MNTTTKPGVLAVMDDLREIVYTTLADPEGAATVREARAAVAELADSVDEVVRTGQGMFRLRRALAAFRGEA